MASAEVSAQSDVPPAAAGPELPRLGAAAGGMPCYDAQSVAARVACLRGCAAAAAPAAVEGGGGDGVDESAAAGGSAAHAHHRLRHAVLELELDLALDLRAACAEGGKVGGRKGRK